MKFRRPESKFLDLFNCVTLGEPLTGFLTCKVGATAASPPHRVLMRVQ